MVYYQEVLMNNGSNAFPNDPLKQEGNIPQGGKLRSKLPEGAESKLKDYGKKSLAPVLDLVHKYQDDISPYFTAIQKGLQGALNAFNQEGGEEAEKVVAGWFREASEWFTTAGEKLRSQEPRDLLNYLEEQGRKSPGLLFSSSYIAGIAFGRMGRHIFRKTMENVTDQGPSFDQYGDQSVKH